MKKPSNQMSPFLLEKQPISVILKKDVRFYIYFLLFFLLIGVAFSPIFKWGSVIFLSGFGLFLLLCHILGTIYTQQKVPQTIDCSLSGLSICWQDRKLEIPFRQVTSINRRYYTGKGGLRWSEWYRFTVDNKEEKIIFSNMINERKLKDYLRSFIKQLNVDKIEKMRASLRKLSDAERVQTLSQQKTILPDENKIRVFYGKYNLSEIQRIEFQMTESLPIPSTIFYFSNGKAKRKRLTSNNVAIEQVRLLLLLELVYRIPVIFILNIDITL